MGTPHQIEPLYTVHDVVERNLIPYHPDTIRELCRKGPDNGGIRAEKVGRHRNAKYLIPESAIVEWRARNTYNPAA